MMKMDMKKKPTTHKDLDLSVDQENESHIDMNTEWDYYSGLPNPSAYED